MITYSKNSQTVVDAVEIITNNGNSIARFIDKIFGGEFSDKAMKFQAKVLTAFINTQINLKESTLFDQNRDGTYSDLEVEIFTQAVNDTMLLNYSNQKKLGPYEGSVKIPLLNEQDARNFLNDRSDEIIKRNENE